MRIAYLLTTADAAAGTERAINTQARGMAARGHRVEILSVFRDADRPHFPHPPRVARRSAIDRRHDALADATNDPSRIILKSWDSQITGTVDRAFPPLLRRCNADIVVASTPALAALAVQFLPDRCVIVEQEHRSTGTRGATLQPIEIFGPRVDCLVSLTSASAEWLKARLGATAPRLEVIPNAIPRIFRPQASCREKLIVSAGRLVTSKRFDHLVRAFAQLAGDYPDWRLRIYGSGPRRNALVREVTRFDLTNRVELVPNVPDLLNELPKASIAALSSEAEGLPLLGLEAIAAGLPFVSYDCPTGPADIIIDGENGFLIPNGDVDSLAGGLRRLMANEDLRVQVGRAARSSSARFDEATINDQWEDLYRDLLSARRTAARRPALQAKGPQNHVWPHKELASVEVPIAELIPSSWSQRNHAIVLDALSEVPLLAHDLPRPGAVGSLVAIAETNRPAALSALARIREPGVRVEVGSSGANAGMTPAELGTLQPAVRSLLVRQQLHNPLAVLPDYREIACEVQFWPPAAGCDDEFAAPSPNRLVDRIAAGEPMPRLARPDDAAGQDHPLWDEPDFPVDAVYTWVDDTDPAWRARKNARLAKNNAWPELASGAMRFRNRDELRYSLRSLLAFCPWVRHVYIVTDAQTPAWLSAPDGRVRVIDHREIFPDPVVLPTFNSHAIETCLHRIPGLAEHFIYMNDDVVIHRPLSKSAFFEANGSARFFPSPTKLNYVRGPEPHIVSGRNNRALLREAFGHEITNAMLHTPHPQRKSVLAEIEATFPEAVAATRANAFRGVDDISVASSLSQYYGYFTGRAIRSSIPTRYVRVDSNGLRQARRLITDNTIAVIAFGEGDATFDDPDLDSGFASLLNDLIPFTSPYEVARAPESGAAEKKTEV